MRKRNLFFIIFTMVGGGLFFWLVQRIGWDKIAEVFTLFQWWHLVILLGLYFLSMIFMSLSMRLILKSLGYRLPFLTIFALTNINLAVGYITPFAYVGGEPVQIYLMYKRYRVPVGTGTANVLIEKVTRQLIAMIFIVFGVILFIFNQEIPWGIRIGLAAFISFLIFVLWAYFAKSISGEGFFHYMIKIFHLSRWKILNNPKVAPVITDIDRRTSDFLVKHRRAFGLCLIYATLAELVPIAQMILVFWFMGINPGIVNIFLLFIVTNLLTFVPSPAQLGTFEASGVSVFAIKGIGAGAGLTWSVYLHIINILSTIPGLVLLPIYGLTIKEAVFNGEEMQRKISGKNIK